MRNAYTHNETRPLPPQVDEPTVELSKPQAETTRRDANKNNVNILLSSF